MMSMTQSSTSQRFKLETPATYRIRVQGHFDEYWSDRLGGMVITRAFTASKQPVTILVGHLRDQAALSGVLAGLYELHLPLLSVENLDEEWVCPTSYTKVILLLKTRQIRA
jgi:hypothetical protein